MSAGPVTEAGFATLTIVVDADVAEEFIEILRVSPGTRDAVHFVTVTPGVTGEALLAGAEPGDWD